MNERYLTLIKSRDNQHYFLIIYSPPDKYNIGKFPDLNEMIDALYHIQREPATIVTKGFSDIEQTIINLSIENLRRYEI